MRKQPDATSTSAGGRSRRASGRAASAATGTTDTVSAAAAGERCQPSTRSSTSRNNAAVRAADSSARVRLGRSAGRCRSGMGAGTADTASAAGTASTAIGTCTTKIACQENACVSSPPTTGPVAVPTTPAVTHAATPRRSPYSATRSSRQPIRATAPPSACTQRAASSTSIDGADAHNADEPANTAMPTAQKICGRARVNSSAMGTATSPSTRLNEISTQATCADRGVQVPQDVGQGERHHRGVRQHQRHRHREQRSHGATHRGILAPPPLPGRGRLSDVVRATRDAGPGDNVRARVHCDR